MTREKRSGHSDRRHGVDMPLVPFKDSNGATINECRRKIPDRRITACMASELTRSCFAMFFW